MSHWTLMDERARPTLRERLGRHLVRADGADFAVARIRLAALDLTDEEIAGTARWRVLLGELDAAMLLDAWESVRSTRQRDALARLRAFADSGRLQVRSAGLGSWAPDFAVVRSGQDRSGGADEEDTVAGGGGGHTGNGRSPEGQWGPSVLCAVGAIYFGRPRLAVGPSLTVVTSDPEAARRAGARFDELWERAHDVLPAIVDVLDRAHGVAAGLPADRR